VLKKKIKLKVLANSENPYITLFNSDFDPENFKTNFAQPFRLKCSKKDTCDHAKSAESRL
jgi:hypothetical protein